MISNKTTSIKPKEKPREREVLQVRHRDHGKLLYYDPCGKRFSRGDLLIINLEKGKDYGSVLTPNHKINPKKISHPLLTVVRMANPFDKKKIQENVVREKEAFQICLQLIEKLSLKMKLISSEYFFDRRRIRFRFTASGKVDFRELVKKLVERFRISIELRQVGVRDAAKFLGGVGICGRVLCCQTHLETFSSVNLKMVTGQNLAPNPDKTSGICGRLRCCLKYEYEDYRNLKKESQPDSDAINKPNRHTKNNPTGSRNNQNGNRNKANKS